MESQSLIRMVDRAFARWQSGERNEVEQEARPPPGAVVAIAHALGAEGPAVGDAVARALGLPLYDRELVALIAQLAAVHAETVAAVDRRNPGRLEDFLCSVLRNNSLSRTDYLRLLRRVIGRLQEQGPCVLVGHGSVHVVPRSQSLVVFVTAPLQDRVSRIARREGRSPSDVRERVLLHDLERSSVHYRYFGAHREAPRYYDLILDVTSFGVLGAASLIIDAFVHKFARRPGR